MEDWIRNQRRLLDLEAQSETAILAEKISSLSGKQCESEGLSILSLEITQMRNELFGRCCLTLEKVYKLPLNVGFKVGDEVSLVSMSNEKPATKGSDKTSQESNDLFGLVRFCNQQFIEIVVDDYDDSMLDPPYRLNLRPSLKTHLKMMEALTNLVDTPHPLFSLIHRTGLPQTSNLSSYLIQDQVKVDNWVNQNLNPSQKKAVECCLNSRLVGVIHGPPGTGKTSTVIELILQSLLRGEKLLVCAPSNIAVDTILARVAILLEHLERDQHRGSLVNLQKLKNQIVRLGHPARVSTSILHYTLDYLISIDERTEIVTDVRNEIDEIRKKLYRQRDKRSNKSKKWGDNDGDTSEKMTRKELRVELKAIQKEVVQREKAVVEGIMKTSRLVLATCVGAASHLLRDIEFDTVIIDEAAQGLEAACWIPILQGKKCILAGDHCQLPPTIKSKEAEAGGLSVTLFEKIIKDSRFNEVVTLLNIQYRMNDLINIWASKNMYQNQVISDDSVHHHTLLDLLPVFSSSHPSSVNSKLKLQDLIRREENSGYSEEIGLPVLMMIDTSNAYMYEDTNNNSAVPTAPTTSKKVSTSHSNHHEVDLILKHVLYLVKKGIQAKDIGIITPYNGQLELLKQAFAPYLSNFVPPPSSAASAASDLAEGKGRKVNLDGIEIKTIDGFQGGEKECILLSFVRSNPEKIVGFLGENRRINVAITRAKRHLTIVCDSETCRTDRFINTLIEHMEEFGEVVPVDFYVSEFLTIHSSLEFSNSEFNLDSSLEQIKEIFAERKQKLLTEGGDASQKKQKEKSIATTQQNKKREEGIVETEDMKNERLIQQIHEILTKYQKNELKGGKLIQKKDSTFLFNHLLPVQSLSTAANKKSSATKDSSILPLQFPASLNSFLRMKVHEIATDLGLFHESFGEGKQRYVSVSKISLKEEEGKGEPAMEQNFKKEGNEEEEEHVEEQTEEPAAESTKFINEQGDVDNQAEEDGEEKEDEEDEEDETPKDTKNEGGVEAKKKSKKKSKGKNKPKPSTDPNTAFQNLLATMGEDEFLAAQIEQNRKLAELHQYRIGSRPMPNYEKEYAKDKLKSKLAEKQDSRKVKIEPKSSSSTSNGSSGSNKKVVKKPVPNFGGGKVGSK